MSSVINYIVYDISNYEIQNYDDFNTLKEFLKEKLLKKYFIIEKAGNDYKDITNDIIQNKNQKLFEYVVYNNNMDFISSSLNKNIILEKEEYQNKINNQLKIEKIISEYLEKKKSKIQDAFTVCKEIKQKCENIKNEGEDSLKKFQEYFSDIKDNEELKIIIERIKLSINKVKEISPKYNEDLENIEKTKDQAFNEIDKIIDSIFGPPPDTNDINELKKVYDNFTNYINDKVSRIIEKNELIYELSENINSLLINAEKMNFFINLSNIPKIYESFKPNLKEELKRRSYFKCIYENIIEKIQTNFFAKEFEQRKNFFKSNNEISQKSKIEGKTIEIINKLFDFEQEKIYDQLKQKIMNNSLNNLGSYLIEESDNNKDKIDFDKDFITKIEDLNTNLQSLTEGLYSKKKKEKKIEKNEVNAPEPDGIDNNEIMNKYKLEFEEIKKKLTQFSVPEIKQKEIIDIIGNKIIKKLPNSNDKKRNSINDNNRKDNPIFASDIMMSGMFDKSSVNFIDRNNLGSNNDSMAKMANYFTDKYSKFLWFYNKIYRYLEIYNTNSEKKFASFNKEDPFSVNNCIVEVLNDNKKMKEKIQKIKGLMK